MNHTAFHLNPTMVHVQFCRITDHPVERITDLGTDEQVVLGVLMDMDTAPLAADTVVGQIVEHVIKPVATHHTVFGLQGTIDVKSGPVMEEERRIPDGQRSPLLHLYATKDDQRRCRFDQRVLRDHRRIEFLGIPHPGLQTDLLFDATLKGEQQVVLHKHRLLFPGLSRCQFHKHEEAVIAAYLHIRCLRAIGIVEIDTVYIHPIARLVTSLEADAVHADARIILIMHPERIGRRRGTAEDRIHQQRI